jgi:hypothetical protein
LAAFLLAVGLVVGVAPAPAAAWSNGACPTSSGVTVVVDFTAVDAGVVIRCVPGAPRSGIAALADAGFAVVQVTTMPGFVCRIDGRPGPGAESCATTPPADAYWTYWTASRGGDWAYSPAGPAGSRPAQGAVEGWSFTTGETATPPSVAPPPAAAATPRPTVAPTARPVAPATPGTTAAPASTPGPTVALTATPVASPRSGGATPPAPPSATPLATPSATPALATETAAASPPAGPGHSSSSGPGDGPVGTVAGIGLLVAVGGGAVIAQRRSRRTANG